MFRDQKINTHTHTHTHTHMDRHTQYTRNSTRSYLGEVAHQVTAFVVVLGEDVEEEGLHIIVQSLVVQEKLGQQAEVLAEEFADISIHLNGTRGSDRQQ